MPFPIVPPRHESLTHRPRKAADQRKLRVSLRHFPKAPMLSVPYADQKLPQLAHYVIEGFFPHFIGNTPGRHHGLN